VVASDFDAGVVGLPSQPFRLSWPDGRWPLTHMPDYVVRLRDRDGVVVEVRADDRIDSENAVATNTTARACESIGWQLSRVLAIPGARTANAGFLAGYRHPCRRHAGRAAVLQRVFGELVQLREGVRRVGDPIAVLPTLRHLRWRLALDTDPDSAPLSASSPVRCHS
jgi:hypothetical protein